MIRRGLSLGAVLIAVCAAAPIAGGAATPAGPRLALIEFGSKPDRLVLKSVGADGSAPLLIAGGGKRAHPLPLPLEPPSWSGDGTSIAFSGANGKVGGTRDFLTDEPQVFVAVEDGSELRALPETTGGLGPVFAPDGQTVAFARQRRRTRKNDRGGEEVVYESATVWLADLRTGHSTRLTPWRRWLKIYPSSFSPDGSTLLVARAASRDAQSDLVAMRIDGGGSAVLARKATDGVYSPDGSAIAFLRPHLRIVAPKHGRRARVETTSDLYSMRSDGSSVRRLTRSPTGIELWPSWDPSGKRLAYTRLRGGSLLGLLGFGDAVVQVNADGSCASTVLGEQRDVAYYGATWQPGPGREAGPIAC